MSIRRIRGILTTAVILFVMLFNPFSPAQAEGSYPQFRADVPDSFVYETTTVYGDHISINVPIVLPEVSEIPVLRVKWNLDKNGSMGRWIETQADEADEENEKATGKKKSSGGYAESFPLAEDRAPGIEASLDEAARAVLDVLNENIPDTDFEYYCGYAESGTYLIPNDVTVDYDEMKAFMASHDPIPGCEKGRYSIRIRQVLQGIPVFFQHYFMISNINDPVDMCPRIMAYYTDSDDIRCYTETVYTDSAAAENVNLLPYAEIEKQIREMIDLGLIRQMDRLELGYMLYYEHEVSASSRDAAPVMLAVPTWNVTGDFSMGVYEGEGPEEIRERTKWGAAAEKKLLNFIGNDCVRIDAITGRFLYSYEDPAPRVYNLQVLMEQE